MEQKKKALGRGLEQLFSSEVLDFDTFEDNIMESAKESDIVQIPVKDIRPNPFQPRRTFDQESLDELATSIKNYGVFQPIIVKKSIKGYDLVAGERRLRASKLAGLENIPAIVKEFSDEEMREIALLENIQRENLTSIELAWAYKGIIDSLHIRQEDLAAKIGKSRSHVTNTLGLLRLPNDVQDMVLDNKISMGHARVLSKMDDNNKVEELANKVVKDNISVRDLEDISSKDNIQKKVPIKKASNSKDNEYKYVENELRDMLGTKVKVENKKIEIFFNSSADLTRILDILNVKVK
ncbi:MAG: ParB/RepB/Spo0J family partition protein [Bacilli bacterium]|nr:ParB/RepB/Spo0J family partition protein [Bacilli bacterium]